MQNLEEPSRFVSNYKKEIKSNIRLLELLDKNEKEVISSKNREFSKLLQKSIRLKKERNQKIYSWQKSKKLILDTVNNDKKFIRVETCSIINEINFSISPKNISKSVYEDKFSSKKKQNNFVKNLKSKKSTKDKQFVVNESEYSFSDDSIDYSISPIVINYLK
jgi:hypothetical protein